MRNGPIRTYFKQNLTSSLSCSSEMYTLGFISVYQNTQFLTPIVKLIQHSLLICLIFSYQSNIVGRRRREMFSQSRLTPRCMALISLIISFTNTENKVGDKLSPSLTPFLQSNQYVSLLFKRMHEVEPV